MSALVYRHQLNQNWILPNKKGEKVGLLGRAATHGAIGRLLDSSGAPDQARIHFKKARILRRKHDCTVNQGEQS